MKPIDGARKIVKESMNLRSGEKIVIVTEEGTMKEANYFLVAAEDIGAQAAIIVIPNLEYNGEEPAELVGEVMQLADVAIIASKNSLATTSARIKATESGTRIFSIAGFTEEMLWKGCIEADFQKAKVNVWKVAEKIGKAKKVRLVSQSGAVLEFSVEGRPGRTLDAIAHDTGCFRSMSIEANAAPVEDTAEGVLIVDGAAPTGLVREDPIKLTFAKGTITKIEGNDAANRLEKFLKEVDDPNIYRVAEFGIGLNPAAKLTGFNYVEDESAIGTAHIGIGRNVSLGGKISARAHFDLIVDSPSIYLDDEALMKDGKILI